jgi:hypothetical protein
MAVLLLAEHDNKTLAPATAKVLDAAAKFGGEVDILIAGENAQGVAEELKTSRDRCDHGTKIGQELPRFLADFVCARSGRGRSPRRAPPEVSPGWRWDGSPGCASRGW